MQAEFVTELFAKLHANGVNTCLDTSGSILNDSVKELLKFTDIVLLDYTDGEVIKIRLTEQETILADEAEDFEEFLRSLEEKYHFRLDNCCWMSTSNLKERSHL